MINKLSTPPIEAGRGSSETGSSKTLLYVAGFLILGYLAYRFLIKPKTEENVIVYEDTDYTDE